MAEEKKKDELHTDAAKGEGGTIDQKVVAAHAREWLQRIDDGKEIIVTMGQQTVDDPTNLSDLDDLLDNDLIQKGDEVYIFVRRARA